MSNVVMRILLVEDDEQQCEIYKKLVENNKNIKLIGITSSSKEAIKLVKEHKPEGVILDMELTNGEGSGFDFIEGIEKDKCTKIVVTTNIYSDSVYNFLHKNKIDFIFYKNQANYSQENVLNTLIILNEYDSKNPVVNMYTDEEDNNNEKLSKLINQELDLIGVSSHLKGRKYLFDSILFVIENSEKDEGISTIQYLVSKYKRSNSTISRAMQNAILHAWRISSIEDLAALYTARINYETGVPTPTEFIYYYADKVKKML